VDLMRSIRRKMAGAFQSGNAWRSMMPAFV
jgi:hypothetical protein